MIAYDVDGALNAVEQADWDAVIPSLTTGFVAIKHPIIGGLIGYDLVGYDWNYVQIFAYNRATETLVLSAEQPLESGA